MEFEKLTEEQKELVRMNRAEAGLETPGEVVLISEIVEENEMTLEEQKEKRNENERRRIRQSGGLRPNAVFKYSLIDWEEKIKDITIKYPSTTQAIKYSKMAIEPESGKGVFIFADIINDFIKDKLLPHFNLDDFPVTEATELAMFLSETIKNPRFK